VTNVFMFDKASERAPSFGALQHRWPSASSDSDIKRILNESDQTHTDVRRGHVEERGDVLPGRPYPPCRVDIKDTWLPLNPDLNPSARDDSANAMVYYIGSPTGRFGSPCSSSLPGR
jgi:hypothetical protein